MTNICKWLINDYLDLVTVGWFNHHDLPPTNLSDYDHLIDQMRIAAMAHAEFELLKQAFEAVLGDSSICLEDFGGGRYPFDSQEVRDIMSFVFLRLWPLATVPSAPPADIQIYDIPHDEWYRARSATQKR